MTPRLRVPLTLLQEEMWLLEQAQPEDTSYNDTVNERLSGPVDVPAVTGALARLVERHETLRTTFPVGHDGVRYQSIAPSIPIELAETDLSDVPAEDGRRARELIEVLVSEQRQRIDVATRPPLRARLVHLGGEGTEIVVTLNHLVSDRTSLTILMSELSQAYEAFRTGSEPSFAPLPVQYADFAVWQRGWLTEDRLRQECGYWRRKLAGLGPPAMLPYDRAPGAGRFVDLNMPSAAYDFRIAADIDAGVRRLARSLHTTVSVVFTAGLKAVIARWSGQTDVAITTASRGRERPELEGIVGLFAGMAVLRTDLSGDPPFGVVVARAQESLFGLLEHHHVPHLRVFVELRAAGTIVDFPGLPVDIQFFPVSSDRWRPGTSVVARPPGEVEPAPVEMPEPSKPLGFSLYDDGRRTWGRVSYRADLLDRATVEKVVDWLQRVLAAVSDDSTLRLSELPPPTPRRLSAGEHLKASQVKSR